MIMQGGIYNDFAIFACLMNHRIKQNIDITIKTKYEHKKNVFLHHLQ